MSTPLRVLLVEDCEDDGQLILRELRRGGYDPVWKRVDTTPALTAAIDGDPWDIVLCDYALPTFSGPAVLDQLKLRACEAPVIIVSGEISQEAAIAAMRAGARDFVMKDNLARLVPAVARELAEAETRKEQRRAEDELQQRREFEGLISGISSRFLGIRSAEVGKRINEALREIGEFTGASLGYAFVFVDGTVEYGWHAPGETTDLGQCAARASRSPWWQARLGQGEPILVSQVAALPAEAAEERAHLSSCGVESAVAVPMAEADALRGFFGFATVRVHRMRNDDIVIVLRIVGEIFAGALQHQRSEAALRESERHHRELIENLSEVIYTIDSDGRITYVSPNVESIGGYRPEEIVGRSFTDFIHPDDLVPLLESYQRTIAGRLEPSEYRVIAKSGNAIWVRTFSRPIIRQGEVTGLQAVLMDITDRKQAEERQQLFELLVEQAPVGIIMTDAKGQVTSANPAALKILGSPSEEATKQFNVFTLPNLVSAGISEVFRRAVVEKSATQIEAPYRSYWGRESVVRMQIVPLFGRPGDVRGTLSIVEETTERAQWETALRASEQRLRSVLDGLGPRIFVGLLSPEGHILEVNEPWLAAAGVGLDAFRGNLLDRIPGISHSEAGAARVRDGIEQAVRGRTWRGDIEVRLRSGGFIVVDLFLGPLTDDVGAVVYLVASGVEITDRTRAERELRRLNADLERRVRERTAELEVANRELEAFTSAVSHDLRAPLRVIDGFAEALEKECAGQLQDGGRGYVTRIRNAAGRMGQLIDDLLSLSRVAHGHLALALVDLSGLAQSVARELQRANPQRRVTFVIASGVAVRGDARLLRVAMENLLGNAWKYTGKHPSARIEFGVRRENGGLVYFVGDDGAGFDMRHAGELFNPFRRLHGGGFEGTGIGLATVARIIRRHGGRIWAEGAVERGATFSFTLPNPA